MTFADKLRAAAAHLGCKATPESVREACLRRADQICGEIGGDLQPVERLDALANFFSVEFHVADTTAALDEQVARFAKRGDAGFALRRGRFDGELLAAILRRRSPGASDRRFIALVDARGHKRHMAFFSKTHEVAHPALEPQLAFEYRDETQRRDEWERFVDLVGAECVFAGEPWERAVQLATTPNLTVSSLEALRQSMAPEASLTAVALAAGNTLNRAVFVVWAELGSSKADPSPVLRLKSVVPNNAALQGSSFLPVKHRVPSTSPLAIARSSGEETSFTERLNAWVASNGKRLPDLDVWTSASPRGDGVIGIVMPRQPRGRRQR